MEIEGGDPTLKPRPTNADPGLPTASGWATGSTGRVGEPETPDSPEERIN